MATSQAAVAHGDHAVPADSRASRLPPPLARRDRLIVGALMDMIDVTIVNVALPSIRRDLHASATQLEWVVSGYMLAFAAALIIAGNLGDKFGRKRVFLVGVALFGLASLAAGLSGSGAELIAARVVQGAAAAAMAPQVLATFRVIFAPGGAGQGVRHLRGDARLRVRGRAGPRRRADRREPVRLELALGVLRQRAGGRGRADRRRPPRPRDPDPRARRPDLPGAVLLAGSLVAIVYPLLEGRQLGWPAWVWALLAAGVAGVVRARA